MYRTATWIGGIGRRLGRFAAAAGAAFAAAALAPVPAHASGCLPIAAVAPQVLPAAVRVAAVPARHLQLTFVGHASFLIETPEGVTAATDYNDYIRPAVVPDVATMNNAHSTHFSVAPDPGVRFLLRGWDAGSGAAVHDLRHRDLRVRNVPTNVRSYEGTRLDGNSIFVFEAADLCVAHLGHIHHLLTPEHLGALGQVDVLLAPVDGGYTIDVPGIVEIIDQIKPPLVIPMHYFSAVTLRRFVDQIAAGREVRYSESPTVLLSRETLPVRPQVLVLPGR